MPAAAQAQLRATYPTLSWIKRSMSVDGWYSDVIIKRFIVCRIIGWMRLSYVACSRRMAVPKIASKKHKICVTVNWKREEKRCEMKSNESFLWMTRQGGQGLEKRWNYSAKQFSWWKNFRNFFMDKKVTKLLSHPSCWSSEVNIIFDNE